MTGAERGFLLLTGSLGDPERHPLTLAQLRTLAQRARAAEVNLEERELEEGDLLALGCSRDFARRVLALLAQESQLNRYLERGAALACSPISRIGEGYPHTLRARLGLDAPAVLWAKGNFSLLEMPKVSLVGSRDLHPENRTFARAVGRQAARQGYALVSGNARGADREAQEACLEAGGSVISVVADELYRQNAGDGILWLSEEGFDLPFSAQRALRRNRIIHALGAMTFVAQSDFQKGGTWDGTTKNLRFGWSPVWCFADGSQGTEALAQMGAGEVTPDALGDFDALISRSISLFDQ